MAGKSSRNVIRGTAATDAPRARSGSTSGAAAQGQNFVAPRRSKADHLSKMPRSTHTQDEAGMVAAPPVRGKREDVEARMAVDPTVAAKAEFTEHGVTNKKKDMEPLVDGFVPGSKEARKAEKAAEKDKE